MLTFSDVEEMARMDSQSVRASEEAAELVRGGEMLATLLTESVEGLDLKTAAAVLEILGNAQGNLTTELVLSGKYDGDELALEKMLYANSTAATHVVAAGLLFDEAAKTDVN
jgi:hypothetical protein